MTNVQELLGSAESIGVWNLVPDRSTIAFKTKSMYGLVPVKGRFHEISGDGQITDPGTIFGRIDIKAASLDTKVSLRDKHLRSADFFDVEKYPDISVVVTSAEGVSGDTVDLRANLTVKDTTAPMPLHAKVAVLGDGSVRVTAAADIKRKDFGVSGNMVGMIRDATTLTADVVFRRVV
jgi:polyisoprenoid-binding protein YceI